MIDVPRRMVASEFTKMLQNAPSCLPAGRQVDGDECSGFKIR